MHYQQLTHVDPGSIGPFDLKTLLINGNTGVALFFVLSGVLLSLPYWRVGKDSGPLPSLGGYWLRRLARILPAYYLCLTVLVIQNGYWQKSSRINDVLSHYLLFFNYSDRWFYSINPPFWTIGIEVQFYILLPFVLLAIPLIGRRVVWLSIAVLMVMSYLAHYWIMSHEPMVQSFFSDYGLARARGSVLSHSILAHLPLFLLGVLVGPFVTPRNRETSGAYWEIVFWGSALVVLIVLATRLSDLLVVPFGRYNLPLVPVCLAAVVVAAPRSRSASMLLESLPIRRLGVISYGVYLFHLPVQKLIAKIMGSLDISAADGWWLFGIASLGLTIIVASLSFWMLEGPILRATAKWSS